jgi:hypothetical protein
MKRAAQISEMKSGARRAGKYGQFTTAATYNTPPPSSPKQVPTMRFQRTILPLFFAISVAGQTPTSASLDAIASNVPLCAVTHLVTRLTPVIMCFAFHDVDDYLFFL